MRFACQSCGKAYNLPEEKIADKSNVKLKCRVCGAIVEVKKQGEVVAAVLTEGDNKRSRVSEAPAPLTSMMPDDSDDATHAIAVSDQILSESGSGEDAAAALMGHVKSALGQRGGLGPLPPPAPTGFGSPPPPAFGAPSPAAFAAPPPTGFGSPPPPAPAFGLQLPTGFAPPDFAPTPVPPPLSAPELPRAELAYAPPPPSLPSGLGGPPPPLPNLHAEPMHAPGLNGPGAGALGGAGFGGAGFGQGSGGGAGLQNGSNGAARFGDAIPLPDEPSFSPMGQVALSASSGDMGSYAGPAPVDMQLPAQQPASGDDTTRKMLAALATGILIGFIIARLFF